MINLTAKEIENISEDLEIGSRVFYNLERKEIKSLFYSHNPFDYTEELAEEWEEIEVNWGNYIEIKGMNSDESFALMCDFAEQETTSPIKERLIKALNRSKPFRNFKAEIDQNTSIRSAWFKYKKARMINWVKDQISEYNKELKNNKG